MIWPDLRSILDPLLWGVIGAVATRLYMPERVTADLDIMVGADEYAEAEERLKGAAWERGGDLSVGGSTWRSPEGVQLDLLACEEAWCKEALDEAQGNPDGQGLPILPLPYLVLLKLTSGRTQDVADVTRMLGQAEEASLARVPEAVGRYSPDDAEDLEALIELGKLETEGRPPEGNDRSHP